MKISFDSTYRWHFNAPTVDAELYHGDDGEIRLRVWCEHCEASHFHGPRPGHREAHIHVELPFWIAASDEAVNEKVGDCELSIQFRNSVVGVYREGHFFRSELSLAQITTARTSCVWTVTSRQLESRLSAQIYGDSVALKQIRPVTFNCVGWTNLCRERADQIAIGVPDRSEFA